MQEFALDSIAGPEPKTIARCSETTAPSIRLASLAALTADDRAILRNLRGRTVPAGTIVHSGSNTLETPGYFLSGWGGRLAIGASNHRQIITLLLPGDGFGIGALPWAGERLSICALTDSILLDATTVRDLVCKRSPTHLALIEGCERASVLEQEYTLNQTVRLGRPDAYERVAHFILELYTRLSQVGQAEEHQFIVPLQQRTMAEMLGLSRVHFNRVARGMKKDGLVDFRRGSIQILDPVALARVTAHTWMA